MNDLLKLLRKNARLSNAELAVMLGRTEEDIAAEITQLECDGIIRGYTAVIDSEALDRDVVSALIELRVAPKAQSGFDDIAKIVSQYDEVESVTLMSGAYDISIRITGSSLRTISQFVAQRLSAIDGVLSTATHFVLKSYKENGIHMTNDDIDERGFVSP
ncbi:MAG: Lrp/AsnC family transcriptional regulator [Oscillospiraceae bacterium]